MNTVGLAVALFVSTNIDDVFVLIGFIADPKFGMPQVIAGQFLGIAALVAASLLLSLVSLVLSDAYLGLLGVLPMAIGGQKLFELWRGDDDDADPEPNTARIGNVFAVAAVTVANGGDNIGAYTPVFATSTASEIVIIVSVFATMIAMWVGFSYWLVNHPTLGAPIRRFARVLTPVVLIAIGVFILVEAGSFSLLLGS